GHAEKSKRLLNYTLLIVFGVLMVFPLVWMLLSSLKTTEEIFQIPITWLPSDPQWANFLGALELAPFGLYIYNSTITALFIVIFQTILSSMIAYALTQLEFKGKNLLF